ncbi:hypothetical protein [Paraburkholderia graminis]
MLPTEKDRKKYTNQMYGTGRRTDANGNPIEWKLTFEQWWEWWQATGHYAERGKGGSKYCMARLNDIGPYEIGNIYCVTNAENTTHALKGKTIPAERVARQTAHLKGNTFASLRTNVYPSDETISKRSKSMQLAWEKRKALNLTKHDPIR